MVGLAVNVAFPSCGEWVLLCVVVRELLITVAWLVAEQGLEATQASVIVAQALSCPAECGCCQTRG